MRTMPLDMTAQSEPSFEPAAHYDRVHEAWRLILGDEFHYGVFETAETALAEATAALTQKMKTGARIAPGDRLLDVGCGTGHQSCDLAQNEHAVVLGITTSESGVAAATALATTRHLDNARFELRDGTDNGLPDASFDVVWALESSHLMRDRQALLSESVRVLAPGGRLVLCDIIRHREIPFKEVRARRHDFAILRAVFGDAHMEPIDQYAATLEELGMTVENTEDITGPTLPTFAAWRANIAANRSEIERLLGADGVSEFVQATQILEAFWTDGTLGYGILAAAK